MEQNSVLIVSEDDDSRTHSPESDISAYLIEYDELNIAYHSAKATIFGKVAPQCPSRCKNDLANVFLQHGRCHADKFSILDAAIDSHHGTAVLQAALLMKTTMNPTSFYHAIEGRPVARQQLAAYYRARNKWDDLDEL